jgi:hypothetical protein
MNAYGVSGCIDPDNILLGISWWVITFTLRPTYLKKSHSVLITKTSRLMLCAETSDHMKNKWIHFAGKFRILSMIKQLFYNIYLPICFNELTNKTIYTQNYLQ